MYQLTKLKKIKGLAHGFSTKQEGNVSLFFGLDKEVNQNQEKFLKKLSISPNDCITMTLQHSTTIKIVDHTFKKRGMFKRDAVLADTLITKEKDVFLFLFVADCLPIILYDPKQKILALAHLGWKGTDQGLSKKVVQKLVALGSNPRNILVGIGPGIHKESYKKLNPEQKGKKEWKPFLRDLPDGQTSIDIVGYNVQQIIGSGVPEKNIEVSGMDTAASNDFFSHYRSKRTEEPEGRFAAVVGMV